MRGISFPPIAWVVCHLLLGCCVSAAQEGAPRSIEETQPSMYYLKDKDGKLQAVPNFTYEDFVELWNLKNQIGHQNKRPLYSIQRLSANGTAREKHVELTIQVTVLVREKDWVRVPLRMDGALLSEPVQYKGPGELFLHFEDDGNGYVCWIRGEAATRHQLSLKMLVPLKTVGDIARLQFRAPRATASELKLTVPIANAIGGVSEGATLLPPAMRNGSTNFTILGLSPNFELIWHESRGRVAQVPTVLEATGMVLVRMDSRSVETEATLSVHSNGTSFDRFLVRLPGGAKLAAGGSTEHTITKTNDQTDNATGPEGAGQTVVEVGPVVEVRRSQKVSDPMKVRLVTTRPYSISKPDKWLELSGFEVIGAARQWGQVAIVAPDDWHVLWGPGRSIRQVEQLHEDLRHEDVVAGFDYFSQPYSLTARLEPKITRVSVEPEYLLLVDADGVRLEATLKYTIRGAKKFFLKVALSQWERDEEGPEHLIDVDRVVVDEDGMLLLPLLQPSTGQLELKISARLPITPSDQSPSLQSLAVPLPQPQADSLGPAAVVVLPADNIELIPDQDATVGLTRQQVDPQMELPDRQQEPLYYRGEPGESVFAAAFRVRPREIDVEVASELGIDAGGANVKQTLAYTIKHEPIDYLLVDVPRSLADSESLTFEYEGRVLVPVSMNERATAEIANVQPAETPVRTRLVLPEPCIGRCELVVAYQLPPKKLTPVKPVDFDVPLVMPADGRLTSNTLLVSVTPEIDVKHSGETWSRVQSGAALSEQRRELRLHSRERIDRVKLAVKFEDGGSSGATVVERAWVQTWLATDVRQDRAVFCFTSDHDKLDLSVPTGADIDSMSVMLDGKRITPKPAPPEGLGQERSEGEHLTIPLSGSNGYRQHLLELRYRFSSKRRHYGQVSLELPQLGKGVWIRRMYWQLVLPPNEHVVVPPAGFTGEFTWGWTGVFWGRQPLLEQAELETWSGAAQRTPVPKATNSYLFSSIGDSPRCEFSTAGRSWIVLVASGVALVGGLLLIYVPISRHPASLFAVAVLLACAGIICPEPTLLIAQAAILGLGLALLAGLLERGVARRRTTTLPDTGSSILERESSQTQPVRQSPERPSSTRLSTHIVPPPTPDSST